MTLRVVDINGKACAEEVMKKLAETDLDITMEATALIDCMRPIASIQIQNGDGHILDERKFWSPELRYSYGYSRKYRLRRMNFPGRRYYPSVSLSPWFYCLLEGMVWYGPSERNGL